MWHVYNARNVRFRAPAASDMDPQEIADLVEEALEPLRSKGIYLEDGLDIGVFETDVPDTH